MIYASNTNPVVHVSLIFIYIHQADEAISDFREPLTTADYCQVIARKAKPHGVRRGATCGVRRRAMCAASHMSSRLRPQHTCARPPLVRCRVTVRKRLRGEVVRKLVKQGFSRTSPPLCHLLSTTLEPVAERPPYLLLRAPLL